MDDQTKRVTPTKPDQASRMRDPDPRHMPPADVNVTQPPRKVYPRVSHAPNHSLISNDFHKRLHGKPTHAAVTRSWYGGLAGTLAVFLKMFIIVFLMAVFVVGGFAGGMLVAYIATAKPIPFSDLMRTDKTQTSFVYD